jgi:hypothetical protein
MSSSEEQANSLRSVRRLMEKLTEMTTDNPATLDFIVMVHDNDADMWLGWNGDIYGPDDEAVGLDFGMTEEEAEAYRKQVTAQEEQYRSEHWNRPEVLEAKEKGILP